MRTITTLVLQIIFSLFTIESFGQCKRSSYVQLCWYDIYKRPHWQCPEQMVYCGYRKPWIQTTKFSSAAVVLYQKNVRYPCNLTFTYTSIEWKKALVYTEHSKVGDIKITLSPQGITFKFADEQLIAASKFHLHQTLGNTLYFTYLFMCCHAGTIQIYDGFENHYILFEKEFPLFSEGYINISTQFNVASVIFYPNRTLSLVHIDLFEQQFYKRAVDVQYLNIDETHRFTNNGSIMQVVIGVNISAGGGFPNVSFNIRTFEGWNQDYCLYGGYLLIHMVTNNILQLQYNDGLVCTRTSPSEPFIGSVSPANIVFGSFKYYFIIYAFGPWFNIDIDIIMRRSVCEGLFEPAKICLATSSWDANHAKDRLTLGRFVEGRHYSFLCHTMRQHNNRIASRLNIFKITGCIIFQSTSSLLNNAEIYTFRAAMTADVTVLMGPKYLPLYTITADMYNSIRVGRQGVSTNSSMIENTYHESYSQNQNQNQNNFISETYNVSNIKINLLLMGANSWKPI